jgi:hypothetical protein
MTAAGARTRTVAAALRAINLRLTKST